MYVQVCLHLPFGLRVSPTIPESGKVYGYQPAHPNMTREEYSDRRVFVAMTESLGTLQLMLVVQK